MWSWMEESRTLELQVGVGNSWQQGNGIGSGDLEPTSWLPRQLNLAFGLNENIYFHVLHLRKQKLKCRVRFVKFWRGSGLRPSSRVRKGVPPTHPPVCYRLRPFIDHPLHFDWFSVKRYCRAYVESNSERASWPCWIDWLLCKAPDANLW